MTQLKNNLLKKGKKGFTLTELAIVIAVIAILIAVLVPTFTSVISNARETAAQEDATNALTAYMLENDEAVPDGSIVQVTNGSYTYYFIVVGGSAVTEDEADSSTYSTQLGAIDSGSFSGYTTFTWTYEVEVSISDSSTSTTTSNGEYYSTFYGTVTIYLNSSD